MSHLNLSLIFEKWYFHIYACIDMLWDILDHHCLPSTRHQCHAETFKIRLTFWYRIYQLDLWHRVLPQHLHFSDQTISNKTPMPTNTRNLQITVNAQNNSTSSRQEMNITSVMRQIYMLLCFNLLHAGTSSVFRQIHHGFSTPAWLK